MLSPRPHKNNAAPSHRNERLIEYRAPYLKVSRARANYTMLARFLRRNGLGNLLEPWNEVGSACLGYNPPHHITGRSNNRRTPGMHGGIETTASTMPGGEVSGGKQMSDQHPPKLRSSARRR
jgi:hypothetical protein